MLITKTIIVIATFLLCFAENEAKLVPLTNPIVKKEVTLDRTKTLSVTGGTSAIRARILRIATDEREELYKLLGINEDDQKLKINIGLYGKEGDLAPPVLLKKGFSIVQGTPSLSLDIHLAQGINESRLEEALIELLLYEIGLQNHTFGPDDPLELRLKPWIAQGIRETLRWRTDRTDRALYARLFEQQSIYPLEELLNEERFDDSLEVLDIAFQVSSGALVMALTNQPQGTTGLLNYIREASTYEGEQKNLLTKHFPDSTLSKNSLAKWWALQLASMSQNPAENLFTIQQSEAELLNALILEIKDKEGTLHQLTPDRFMKLKEFEKNTRKIKVALLYNRLSVLQSRSFPSYRPIISGYQHALMEIIGEPVEKKKKSFWSILSFNKDEKIDPEAMIATLEAERQILAKLGERTTDYLNWYQLERPESQDGNFRDFLEIKRGLENTLPSDGGHISQYLDDINKIYQR